MATSSSQISTFMASLTHHPQAADLIPLVEQLLNVDDPDHEKILISSLQDICSNNSSFLTALWTLRGIILLEEGKFSKALGIFWDALHFNHTVRAPWQQVIELFLDRKELIKASFFLIEAQLLFPGDSDFQTLFKHLSHQLVTNLRQRPGFFPDSVSDSSSPSSELSSRSYSSSRKPLPSSVLTAWDLAQQCLESYLSDHSVIYSHAFIHHAHTSARELLGLDGNFHQGLDAALRLHKLSDFKRFFSKLNHIRNKVQHENYNPSRSEITEIRDGLLSILTLYGPIPS